MNKAAVEHALKRAIQIKEARIQLQSDPELARRGISKMREVLEELERETQKGCAKKTDKTSSQKLKRLPEADRTAINRKLASMNTPNGGALSDYLLASVRTGLRVEEWRNAKIIVPSDDPKLLILLVQNAKANNQRAHRPTRTLTFSELPEDDRAAIERWIARVGKAGANSKALIKSLGDLLYKVTRSLWPRRAKRVCLYSCRHQFAGLAKLRYNPTEVAALMGHATDVTATNHYGRYGSGRGIPAELQQLLELLPAPALHEVQRVREKLSERLTRIPSSRQQAPAM